MPANNKSVTPQKKEAIQKRATTVQIILNLQKEKVINLTQTHMNNTNSL
jgi:hypothetical protein